MRKCLKNTLLDDFMLSLRIAMKQYTIAYCDTAYAAEADRPI